MDSSGNWAGADFPDRPRSVSRSGTPRPMSGLGHPSPDSAHPIDVPECVSLDRYSRLPPGERTPPPPVAHERHYNRLQREFGSQGSTGTSVGGAGVGGASSTPHSQTNTPSPHSSINKRFKSRMSSFFSSPTGSCVMRGQTNDDDNGIDDSSTEGASLMSENTLKTRYEAESPDEWALVTAACSYGCRLVRRTPERAYVWLPGE